MMRIRRTRTKNVALDVALRGREARTVPSGIVVSPSVVSSRGGSRTRTRDYPHGILSPKIDSDIGIARI